MHKALSLLLSFVPVALLVALLAVDISIFGSDAILGASQVSLLVCAGVCIALSMLFFKTPWKRFEEAIRGNVGDTTTAIVILLLIGALSGTWMVSGIVPTFICYGVHIISPRFFLLTACLICAIVSVMTGSSWTTIATVGIALMGIGKAEGFSDGMIAGAIISGAYFGDKISPLSDTTVLASSVNRVPLFSHIRYLMLTTVPAVVIALAVFTVLGFSVPHSAPASVEGFAQVLEGRFHITPWLLVVPLLTCVMIACKMPAMAVLGISALLAAAAALLFQRDLVLEIGSAVTRGSDAKVLFTGVLETIYNSVSIPTGHPDMDKLVASRGMLGMLNTIYLIICAMCFGGCMRASGMLARIGSLLTRLLHRRTPLVAGTVVTGTALNAIVSDQYLSIILTSQLFQETYEKEGFEGRLLSRSVEDSSTITSPLVPWSSCGMTQSTILSVPTLTYLPFCFFNLLSPLVSILVAAIGWKIVRRQAPQASPAESSPQ